VTEENAKTLQFLDLLCDIDRLSDENEDVISQKLKELIIKQNIQKRDIEAYISFFPNVVYKNFFEKGLYDAFA